MPSRGPRTKRFESPPISATPSSKKFDVCHFLDIFTALDRIDQRLRNNARRGRRARTIASAFENALTEMSEDDLNAFFTQVMMNGEAMAVMELPAVQEALAEMQGGN